GGSKSPRGERTEQLLIEVALNKKLLLVIAQGGEHSAVSEDACLDDRAFDGDLSVQGKPGGFLGVMRKAASKAPGGFEAPGKCFAGGGDVCRAGLRDQRDRLASLAHRRGLLHQRRAAQVTIQGSVSTASLGERVRYLQLAR